MNSARFQAIGGREVTGGKWLHCLFCRLISSVISVSFGWFD